MTNQSDSGDTTSLTYDGGSDHSGDMTSALDSKAGTFSASYNPDGSLATESYPGGTVGTYTYDSTGTATGLTYTNGSWSGSLSDSVTANAAGDWVGRSILASSQTYGYDAADRVTTVADTQSGQCTTRSYTYDTDSNRTGQTTGAPNSDGSCQTATTTSQGHSYDAADRTTDSGYAYDTQGDITTTPSADAGGGGTLSATYYASDMVASQNQAGHSVSYQLDPQGIRFASSTDSSTGVTTTNRYADGADSPALVTTSNGGSTRNVTILGSLAAQVTTASTTLELVNLHGDVMATEIPGTNDVGPTATFTYTEFGTDEAANQAAYGWLGGAQRTTTLGGQILMGVRTYNPALGRFDQIDPVTESSANAYDYGAQQPLTHFDTTGQRWFWLFDFYHSGNVLAFGMSKWQKELVADGSIWGFFTGVAAACSLAGPVALVACGSAFGFLAATLQKEASRHQWTSYTLVLFTFGWRWTWWGGYPYLSYDGSYSW